MPCDNLDLSRDRAEIRGTLIGIVSHRNILKIGGAQLNGPSPVESCSDFRAGYHTWGSESWGLLHNRISSLSPLSYVRVSMRPSTWIRSNYSSALRASNRKVPETTNEDLSK